MSKKKAIHYEVAPWERVPWQARIAGKAGYGLAYAAVFPAIPTAAFTKAKLAAKPTATAETWTGIGAVAGLAVLGSMTGSPIEVLQEFWGPVAGGMWSGLMGWFTSTQTPIVSDLSAALTPAHLGTLTGEEIAAWLGWTTTSGIGFGAGWSALTRPARLRDPYLGPERQAARQEVKSEKSHRKTRRHQQWAHEGPKVLGSTVPALRPVTAFAARPLPEPHEVTGKEAAAGGLIGVSLAGTAFALGERVYVDRGKHLVVFGETGTGKSVLLERQVQDSIASGAEVIFINCKEEDRARSMSARLAAYARSLELPRRRNEEGELLPVEHRTGVALDTTDAGKYQPFVGTAAEIRARLMGMVVWTESYYEDVATVALDLALSLAEKYADPLASLPDIITDLVDGEAEKIAHQQGDALAMKLAAVLEDGQARKSALRWASLAIKLRNWTSPAGFRLGEQDFTGFDLPSASEADAAQALLRAVLSDTTAYMTPSTGRRPERDRPLHVYIDELAALSSDELILTQGVNIVERARSNNGRGVYSTQSMHGLGPSAIAARFINNADVMCFRVSDPETAEWVAKVAGTHMVTETSSQREGTEHTDVGTDRRQRAFKIHPDDIKELHNGVAFLKVERAQWAKVSVAMSGASMGRLPEPRLPRKERRALAEAERAAKIDEALEHIVPAGPTGPPPSSQPITPTTVRLSTDEEW